MIYDLRTQLHNEWLSRYGVKVITPPVAEQISIEDARAHLRLTLYGSPPEHYDDDWITDIGIPAAREWCENECARSLAPQTLELGARGFPLCDGTDAIRLPFGPVAGISSITYVDGTGATQTIDAYQFDDYLEPPELCAAYGSTWPLAQASSGSVRIRYNAGYTLASDSPDDFPLPRAIYAAMLLVLGHLYDNRENSSVLHLEEIPLGAKSLLARYNLRNGFA